MNRLYFGDNLQILRDEIKDESVDLIYLDPPFNSSATYNVLFKTPKGQDSSAQISAFEDTWHWGAQAELEYNELLHGPHTEVSEMMQALRKFLGENDMMAYLTMMAVRLLELQRALKPSGSLFLHCDPTASHYLKIVLDGVFGKENYTNEIIWKRTSAHSSAKRFGPVHDTILFYRKSDAFVWNDVRLEYEQEYLDKYYKYDDGDGRLYWRNSLTAAGIRHGSSGKAWRGFDPTSQGAHWKFKTETLDELDAAGKIYWPPNKGFPQIKRYKDELKGLVVTDIWDDIDKINPAGNERLGYPTQKPLALLERIIQTSSREGDVVLDPFCGCGTAVHAAQKLKRQWIGIDITHLAIALIEKRLRDAFPGLKFEVHGTPKDLDGARDLAERGKYYEFQYWACSLVNAQPFQHKRKGADSGIDGLIYFQDDLEHVNKALPKKIIVSVKGGENVSVQMVRDLRGVVEREKAAIGLFVTLAEPTKPMREEAVKAGYYTSPSGANFPRLQVLSVKGLLNQTERPKYPADLAAGGHTFKKAVIDHGKADQGKLFK